MDGSAQRLIKKLGTEYTVRNASETTGDRETPTYSDDGKIVAVLEQRGQPRTVKDSSGEEVDADLELRALIDPTVYGDGYADDYGAQTIRETGDAGYPSKLVHSSGQVFEVLAITPEDSGVTVMTVVRA